MKTISPQFELPGAESAFNLAGQAITQAAPAPTVPEDHTADLFPARTGAGTHTDPIRYEHIERTDPDRAAKRKAQLDQFSRDAKAGKVLCLSDLMISAGM